MLYYKLSNAIEIEEIGHYPQTSFSKGHNPSLPNSHWQVRAYEFPNFSPNFDIELHRKSEATNIIDGIGGYHGILLDEMTKNILEKAQLPPHRFHPINVVQSGKKLDYYWFHFITNNFINYIDTEKSTIKIQHNINDNNFVVQPVLSIDYLKRLINYYNSQLNYNIIPENIYFTDNWPNYDLFTLDPWIHDTIISSKLKKILSENNLNGFITNLIRSIKNKQ